jgi:hypothetical protein
MDWGERSSTGDEKSSPTEGSAEFKTFSQVRIHTQVIFLIAVAADLKLNLRATATKACHKIKLLLSEGN